MHQSADHDPDHLSAQHPANHPAEPDHPMELNGCSVPGDSALMLRIQLEELMMTGTPLSELRAMMNDPQFQSLFAAGKTIGKSKADAIFNELAAAVGTLRCRITQSQDLSHAVDLTISAAGHQTNSME